MSHDTTATTPRWRQVLDEQGRSLAWLANRTGISSHTVYAISMGRRRATGLWLGRVSVALGVPVELLTDEEAA